MSRASDIINRAAHKPNLATRRAFIQSAGAGGLVLALARARKAHGAIFGFLGGSPGTAFSGFYPAGHWIAAKQSLLQIYPIQDASTSSWAPHQFAYWDGTAGVQYRRSVVPAFGAFPFVFQLMDGPPGMTLGATIWDSSWNCGGTAPAAADYGKVLWTPTGTVTNQQVWVRVYGQDKLYLDFKWTVSTSDAVANGGVFVFVDNVNGSSSNPGTLASPYDSLTTACGSTYSTAKNAGAIVYVRGSTTAYAMPAYSDNTLNTSLPYFELNGATKPSAIIGYPGETATLDATTAMLAFTGADSLIQDLSASGYISTVANYKLITHVANRQTVDSVAWSGGGYGSTGTSVPGMMGSADLGAGSDIYDIAHVGCSDNDHESGFPGNNYSGCVMYSVNGYACYYCEAVSPSATSDGAWYMKSSIQNGSMGACLAKFSSCTHAFDFGQQPSGETMANSESRFNTGLGVAALDAPSVSGTGPLWVYRNSLNSGSGHGLFTAVSSAAYWDANAVQSTVSQPDGGGTTGIANLTATSGLFNSDGTLTSAYSGDVGLKGAQIA